MTTQLKVIGKERVGKIEFIGIEGGFGKGKKAMLVKDIAKIHGRSIREINEVIVNNINRFKNGIDVIDLLNRSDRFREIAKSNGWIGSNRTKRVYLLSERGYAKLLKILDDDKAWDIYDELVDTYFNMRVAITYMTPKKIEEVLTDPDTIIKLATQLKQEREGRLIAEQKVNELTPKATYYDKVLADKSLVPITVIAKDYGMSGRGMNQKLHELGVIYRQGRTWLLYAKYQKTGWTHSETIMVKKKDGSEKPVMYTKWTQKGRLGLYELLKQNDILPLIEKAD